ncbi:ATP-binding protein [Chitinophaga sp. GbtcB8]|uniref:ATP-binding protein n=1 Tax=Chitinophaga sp. GbtcB8 TaxID=2824753 RepID=UPI001C306BCE|nr:ATP-binding protein [Chitinophaga sp. GbtcB8]
MTNPSEYWQPLQTVIKKGKEMYGSAFNITEDDQPTVLKLLYWFLEDKQQAAAHNICLQKGLLLCGPIGCGKTALMQVMRSLCRPEWRFLVIPCHRLALDFALEGHAVVERYTTQPVNSKSKPLTICFDDLGFEPNTAHYGNNCNIMSQILPLRYELFLECGTLTHLTTNLNALEIEERYGNRIRSRMRQMFNIIAFPKNSTDKRK